MAEYRAPLRDMKFALYELMGAQQLWESIPELEGVTQDLVDAILEEGAKINEGLLQPLNREGDEEGCRFNADTAEVTTAKGFKEAYNTYAESGWVGLGGSTQYGGQGMPKALTVLFEEMLFSANSSFALFPVLSCGAALALAHHASDTLKSLYLPKVYEGTWTASMCLTEPHAGTDLGIIRTKAEPDGDGAYRISGTKIFITAGEHDLAENIVHLVLAKLPDAPAGPRGISLFVVPKYLPQEDGSPGDRNSLACGSIEHKMGIKASPTCVMNFDGAKGWLVGEENRGLSYMFTMMNYERLSIGLQGIGASEASYQGAVAYARERLQSRAPTGPAMKDKVADPIIVHPDVRRMLLTQRAYTEGGRAFASYVAMQLDIAKYHPDADQRARGEKLLALLTPVAKAYFTDRGLESCVLGQQVFGGHGYIREWGMEQAVRDVRIAQIYEGTNGIQALDLMGRKIVASGGELLKPFIEDVETFISQVEGEEAMLPFVGSLKAALLKLQEATAYVQSAAQSDPNEIGAASVDYLDLLGLTGYAFVWAKALSIALPKQGEEPFYKAKVETGKFFFARLLPGASSLLEKVKAGASTLMAMDAELF